MKDLPYGIKTLTLTSGEVVQEPNGIRCLAPASLITQYTKYCTDEGLNYLGKLSPSKVFNQSIFVK